MPIKKTIVVVKSLRSLSPKKQYLVSRKPQEGDDSTALEVTALGNTSPTVCIINVY